MKGDDVQILSAPEGAYAIRVNEEELTVLNNALNEVCNGLQIADFETRVGVPMRFAEHMLAQINSALPNTNAN